MTIFFSPPFYFAVKVQGGAGTLVVAVSLFLLEGVKNDTIGAVISSAPVHVHYKRGETLGELLQKLCSAEPCAVCLETGLSQAAFFGLPQIKLLHIGGTIPAARCSHDEL